MITHAYNQRNQYNSTPVQTIMCSIVFADLTIFFFLSFMNICFDTIVSHPPLALMAVLFIIMFLDLMAGLYFNRKITVRFLLNLVIMVFLVLSWTIQNTTTLYFSALVLLRFPEIVHFNDIMKDKLRSNHYLFKMYVLFKIIYMLTVVGHVMGCIFYAIDNSLIKQQYFGSLAENPGLYYQGRLLCYTPIYSLDQTNRYLYCMYYIFSLLATVAYGDIIPKNPFENAYVCVLLILATVSAGFIIEQLLIVLSDHWQFRVQSLKKVRYFDRVLTICTSISDNSRIKLAKYLFHVMMTYDIESPNFNRLSDSLQLKLKKATLTQVSGIKKKQNVQLSFRKYYGMPSFLTDFLVMKLELKYYPSGYLLKHNENFKDSIITFIKLRGQLCLSYGNKFNISTVVNEKPVLFGWRQFILNSKHNSHQMTIETESVCELYQISSDILHTMIKNEKQQSTNAQNFNKMLQSYHICKMKQLASIAKQENQIKTDKSIESATLLYSKKTNTKQKHFFRCWCCGVNDHTPLDCPLHHYVVNSQEILNFRLSERNQDFSRKWTKSKKVAPVRLPVQEKSKIAMNKHVAFELYINRKKQQVNRLKNQAFGEQVPIFEKIQSYEYFYRQYNFE